MSYRRVIPRDLFNGANLLKCYGQLWLKLEGRHGHACHGIRWVERSDAGFAVEQDPADGSITVASIDLFVLGVRVALYRPLNSREPWPLWVRASGIDPDLEDFQVFDGDGNLSPDMLDFIGSKP